MASARSAATENLMRLFDALAQIAHESEDAIDAPVWNNTRDSISIGPESSMHLTFILNRAAIRTERDPDLHVQLWNGSAMRLLNPTIGKPPIYESNYQI